MQIRSVSIKNFRSIESLVVDCDRITAICGTNSSGKSNVLRALKLALTDFTEYNQTKLAENVSSWALGKSVAQIEITFDKPSKELLASLPSHVSRDKPFTYSFRFTRNTGPKLRIGRANLSPEQLHAFQSSILVIYVPAIRDIAADGLRPFRDTLVENLLKQKNASSLKKINKDLQSVIAEKGKAMLDSTKALAKDWMKVDKLEVDTKSISVESLLAEAGIRVKIGKDDFELAKLGTGQQSAVVIKLYRGMVSGIGKLPVYLFEEPDNHLHPTSINVVADELRDCIAESGGQVFFTTHSPYLLNQFGAECYLSLGIDDNRKTFKRGINLKRNAQGMRRALGKFGLRPAEALLAKRVVVVEGANDANFLRTLIELETGYSPEFSDISIIPAGGKSPASELCALLDELGADWKVVFDWDALEDATRPYLKSGLTAAERTDVDRTIRSLQALLNSSSAKKSKLEKSLDAVLEELVAPRKSIGFVGSIVGRFLAETGLLNATQQATVGKEVLRHQHTNVNKSLEPAGIFVWKGVLEDAIVPSAPACLEAEAHLLSEKLIKAPISAANREAFIKGKVKKLAYEPDRMHSLVKHLWDKKCYNRHEVNRILPFLLP